MKSEIVILLGLVFLNGFIVGCGMSQERDTDCPPPPATFTEMDLVGTWRNGLDFSNDTLIIREDGTYKQIIHEESESFDYESEWMPWWVEYTDIGIPYVHLEGMRLCVVWPNLDCEVIGGGEGTWIDYCHDRTVTLGNEGILTVRGGPSRVGQPQTGITLVPFGKSYEGVSRYYFVEP